MHARQQIREAAYTAIYGNTTAGTAVYKSRIYPKTTVPCINILTPFEVEFGDETEALVKTKAAAKLQLRIVTLQVTVTVKERTGVDGGLDDLCAEVEAIISPDSWLPSNVKAIDYKSTSIELTDQLEDDAGNAVMEWEVLYRVDESDPETIIS